MLAAIIDDKALRYYTSRFTMPCSFSTVRASAYARYAPLLCASATPAPCRLIFSAFAALMLLICHDADAAPPFSPDEKINENILPATFAMMPPRCHIRLRLWFRAEIDMPLDFAPRRY